MNFFVSGVKHHKFYENASGIKEGDHVLLTPEPTNPFDKFAVKVQTSSGIMLGYVPKTISERVSNILSTKETLSAEIAAISFEKEPWYALRINIKEVD
jgi:hypothetical protein